MARICMQRPSRQYILTLSQHVSEAGIVFGTVQCICLCNNWKTTDNWRNLAGICYGNPRSDYIFVTLTLAALSVFFLENLLYM